MSLKTFHIVFIVLSIILSLGYGGWSLFFYHDHGQKVYFVMGILSFIVTVALIIYGIQFFKKINTLDAK